MILGQGTRYLVNVAGMWGVRVELDAILVRINDSDLDQLIEEFQPGRLGERIGIDLSGLSRYVWNSGELLSAFGDHL